jgi:alcohol dehydrogenase
VKAQAGELFRFRFLTEVRFGRGVRSKVGDYLAELQAQKAVLLCDENAVTTSPARELIGIIENALEVLVLNGPKGEPEISGLEALRKEARDFEADIVIGLGGGSTLDTAKGLAAVMPNSKPAAEYQGFDKLEKPALPSVLIPTLFGAGTEVTASAVMINREKKVKGGINGRYVFPRMAVIDPELGAGAPPHVMGATALDALVHSIEGYVARCSTVLSRMYSKQAALLLLPALFKLANNPSSVDALEDVSLGALLAVTGLMHSESGLCGAISYPLGVHHGVPHGLGGGLPLPRAILFNAENGCSLYSDLIAGTFSPLHAAQKLSDDIRELIKAFDLPPLSQFGMDSEQAAIIAREVFGFKAVLDMNPVKIDSPDIIRDTICSALER